MSQSKIFIKNKIFLDESLAYSVSRLRIPPEVVYRHVHVQDRTGVQLRIVMIPRRLIPESIDVRIANQKMTHLK